MAYYNDHVSVAAQAALFELQVMQYEEAIEPDGKGFQWFINPLPTAEEIELRNQLMLKGIEEAQRMRIM